MNEKVSALYGRPVPAPAELGWESRIGGRPWGFPANRWPHTPDGRQIPFLGQILLEPLPLTAYFFMMQTYDADSGECINETFVPENGLSSVVFLDRPGPGLTDGPHLQQVSGIDWTEGFAYEFDLVDGLTDEQSALVDEEERQEFHSSTVIGGGVRWLQGGMSQPRDSSGLPMRFRFAICAFQFPQLDLYTHEMAYVFQSHDDPSTGALVWECT